MSLLLIWTDFIQCFVAIIVNFEQVNVGWVLFYLFLCTFSISRSPSICFFISWIWTTIYLLKFHTPDTHPAIKWADASTKATALSFSIFLFYPLISLALVKKPYPFTSYHHWNQMKLSDPGGQIYIPAFQLRVHYSGYTNHFQNFANHFSDKSANHTSLFALIYSSFN